MASLVHKQRVQSELSDSVLAVRLRLSGRAGDGGSVRYRPSSTSFGAEQP